MSPPKLPGRPLWERLVLAVLLYIAAVVLRFVLLLVVSLPNDAGLAFLTFYPAAVVAFFLLGGGPGWLVTILSAATAYRNLSPGPWAYSDRAVLDVLTYVLSAAFIWIIVVRHRRLETELGAVATRADDLYENAPCGYYSLDANGMIVQANAMALSWFGYEREQVIGKMHIYKFLTERGRAIFDGVFPKFMAEGHAGPLEVELRLRDGAARWVTLAATAILDADGNFVRSRTMAYDVTEARAARIALEALSVDQAAMLDNDLVGIFKMRERTVIWKNAAMERLSGYSHDELIDRSIRLLYQDEESFRKSGQEAYRTLNATGRYRTQVPLRRKDGSSIWVDVNGIAVSPGNGESLWLMSDITALKEHQAHVEHIAFHDALTGLPNRLLLSDRLVHGIAMADRLHQKMMVCYLDLDGFKAVNDRHGHDAGDVLLKEMARRLQGCVRTSDTVARLGGDEYVLLLTPIDSPAEGGIVVDRARESVAKPVDFADGRTARVTASIGFAIYPDDTRSADELMRLADLKMYEVKRDGKARLKAV
jgi:diguanylate cyclase (GGDEF)-like protein/PAS domain S-box-containing protein